MTVVTTGETTPLPADAEEKGIKDTLRKMFAELVHVRIITVVGNATVHLPNDGGGRPTLDSEQEPLDKTIVTIFNLVEGDVTNVIAPSLKDDQAMRDFHTAQVDKSMAVLPSNIAAVAEFGKQLIEIIRQ